MSLTTNDINEQKYLWHKNVTEKGLRTYRTQLNLTPKQSQILNTLGTQLFKTYAQEFNWYITNGEPKKGLAHTQYRAHLTQYLGSRWAGSILSKIKAQATLSHNAHNQYITSLKRRIKKARITLTKGKPTSKHKRRPLTPKEYFVLSRELNQLEQALKTYKFSVTLGGRKTRESDKERYYAKRFFIAAQGETGKIGGNETLSIRGDELRINIPKFLKSQLGDKVSIPMPVLPHGEIDVRRAVLNREPVSIEIRRSLDNVNFELFVQVRHVPVVGSRLGLEKCDRVLGIDVNYDHLAVAVLDKSGNPVGCGHKIYYDTRGSASHSLAQVRHAVNVLVRLSRSVGAGVWCVEDLNGFSDGKSRQDNEKGAWFRSLVSRIPVGVLFSEFSRVAFNNGVILRSVPAAYSSQLAHYWVRDGSDTHDGAAIVIGRRGLGYTAERRGSLVGDKQETSRALSSMISALTGSEPDCPVIVAGKADHVGTHKWLVKQSRTVVVA